MTYHRRHCEIPLYDYFNKYKRHYLFTITYRQDNTLSSVIDRVSFHSITTQVFLKEN
jgi:hypothetical protein